MNEMNSGERRKGDRRTGSQKAKKGLQITGSLLAGITCIILILSYFLADDIYEYQDTVDGVHLPKVDAIVVLAGGRGRIAGAGDIWYRYWEQGGRVLRQPERNPVPTRPPILFVSGMGHKSNWNVFARQLRRGVKDVVRPENVILENVSFNTEANAEWLLKYAEQRSWEKILLITSPYHMKRARYIFERIFHKAGKPIGIETLSIYQEPFEPKEWIYSVQGVRVTVTEYAKWIFYRYLWQP